LVDSTGCRTRLLITQSNLDNTQGQLEWTVYPQDRPCTPGPGVDCTALTTVTNFNPEQFSFPYYPGEYTLQFGTSSDTCEWGSFDRSTPSVWSRNLSIPIVQGPCNRTLNVTDNIPPAITLNGPAVYVHPTLSLSSTLFNSRDSTPFNSLYSLQLQLSSTLFNSLDFNSLQLSSTLFNSLDFNSLHQLSLFT
jgi:hypothetical protein